MSARSGGRKTRGRLLTLFNRFTAAYFVVTAGTGLLLYFRPLEGEREGFYSARAKEYLVMLHNGELFSYLLSGDRYASGLAVGSALAASLAAFAWKALRRGR